MPIYTAVEQQQQCRKKQDAAATPAFKSNEKTDNNSRFSPPLYQQKHCHTAVTHTLIHSLTLTTHHSPLTTPRKAYYYSTAGLYYSSPSTHALLHL
jgi:hypothetical protein